MSAASRCLASALDLYNTPNSSTTRLKLIRLDSCLNSLGVCFIEKYPCFARFAFRSLFASAHDCFRPYIAMIIFTKQNPFASGVGL